MLPLFTLVTLSLPSTKRAYLARHAPALDSPSPTPTPIRDALFGLTTLGFLIVIGSVVVTDALDFALRVWGESS